MKQTENYHLTQWEKSDRIQMEDFNRDNAALDTALTAQAAELAEHTAAIAKLGNCQLYTTTYLGNGKIGEDSPTSLTFPKPPIIFALSSYQHLGICVQGSTVHTLLVNGMSNTSTRWSEDSKTVQWYSSTLDGQLNYPGTTYYVAALLQADV